MNRKKYQKRLKQRLKASKPTHNASSDANIEYKMAEGKLDISSELDALDMDFVNNEITEAPATKKRKKKKANYSLIQICALFVCACCFFASSAILIKNLIDYKRADSIYNSLSDSIFEKFSDIPSAIKPSAQYLPSAALNNYTLTLNSGSSGGNAIGEASTANDIQYTRIKAKLEELKKINRDIIGWIKIEDTDINYPVVWSNDNEFYLTHAYDGQYLRSGTIFSDMHNSSDSISKNYNTVLYGHNMANGAMFADVLKFLDPEFFNSHNVIFYGFDGVYTFEPFTMLETGTDFFYYQTIFRSMPLYEEFLQKMYDNAKIKKEGITFSRDDRIISLSTCTNRYSTGRYCLQARLIKVDKAK